MLHVLVGSDRKKVAATLARIAPRAIRITDAHAPADLSAAISATANMFGEQRRVVLDGTLGNEDMRTVVLAALPTLASAQDQFFIVEEKLDAEAKKKLQKFAEAFDTFDVAKHKEYPTVFKLADHLKSRDKKNMWIAYQRELSAGNAPEAIHGVLFWAAKQQLLAARADQDIARCRMLVASLAELPHEARRHGEELEYALERFTLSAFSKSA